jgi:hypothetical protein
MKKPSKIKPPVAKGVGLMNAGVPPSTNFTDGSGHVWTIDPSGNVKKDTTMYLFQAVALVDYNGAIYAAGYPTALPTPPPAFVLPHWYVHQLDDSWVDTGSSTFPF